MFYMSTAEVTTLFRVTPLTIRRWVKSKKLRPFRVGNSGWMRFNSEDITLFLVTKQEAI